MTQNPYVQMNQADDGGRVTPQAPAHTSILAILSLVFSLLCCIPGLSTLGLLFGGLAIVMIGLSGGRVKGLGLAITGVVIGLILTVVWIGSFAVTSVAVKQFVGTANQALVAFEADDNKGVRNAMSQTATVSDEQIAAFKEAYTSDFGAFQSVPTGISGWFGGLMSGGQDTQDTMTQGQAKYPGATVFPTPATFSSGTAIIVLVSRADDPSQAIDIGLLRVDGSIHWLTDEPGSPDP